MQNLTLRQWYQENRPYIWVGFAVILAIGWGAYFAIQYNHKHYVSEGTVIAKEYSAAWVQTILIPVSSGKTTILVPSTVYHPERYMVQIEGYGRCHELHKRTVDLAPSEWEKIQKGQKLAIE